MSVTSPLAGTKGRDAMLPGHNQLRFDAEYLRSLPKCRWLCSRTVGLINSALNLSQQSGPPPGGAEKPGLARSQEPDIAMRPENAPMPNVAETDAKLTTDTAEAGKRGNLKAADLPLDFLLGVMRDPEVIPRQPEVRRLNASRPAVPA